MNLDDWRSRINDLDDQILQLLTQRAHAAVQIGELKRQQGLPVFVPEREAQVVARLVAQSAGTLPAEAVRHIWREILSSMRGLEGALVVGYLGPAGTFTQQAALQRFGSSIELRPCRTIANVFDELERGQVEFGVVPVENSTEGAVNVTFDRLIETDARIVGEIALEITQHLHTRATTLGEIKVVCSHPQGIAQCREWIAANLPHAAVEEMTSTSAAVERASSDATVAGIASELAGLQFGVPALRRRIEDNPWNSTRFLVMGRRGMPPTGRDKTSILFSMRNEPGVLHSILGPMAERGINLTKIESRPTKRRPWEYVNFVDFEGHQDTDDVRAVLAAIRERCQFLKVLGSYPAA